MTASPDGTAAHFLANLRSTRSALAGHQPRAEYGLASKINEWPPVSSRGAEPNQHARASRTLLLPREDAEVPPPALL